MAIVMANLQLLPVPGFKVLVLKTIKALLPREMGIPQQPLAPCDLAVVDLLLTEGIEELAGAPARRTERCALPNPPQPAEQAAASGRDSGRVSAV
jgi:hypothetical protein